MNPSVFICECNDILNATALRGTQDNYQHECKQSQLTLPYLVFAMGRGRLCSDNMATSKATVI